MTHAERDARAVLEAARRALGPSEEQRHRARSRVMAAMGAGIGVGLGTTLTASAGLAAKGALVKSSAALSGTLGSGSASGGAVGTAVGAGATIAGAGAKAAAVGTTLVAAKWVTGGFLVAVTGAGAVVGSQHLGHAPAETRAAATVVSRSPEATLQPARARATQNSVPVGPPEPAVKAFPDALTAARERPPTAAPSQPAIAEELKVVRQVDEALRAHEPARALEVLEDARRRFGRGELGEEREALGIVAACEIDRTAGAVQARRFVAMRPRSVYVETIIGACHLGEAAARPRAEAAAPTSPVVAPPSASSRFDDVDVP